MAVNLSKMDVTEEQAIEAIKHPPSEKGIVYVPTEYKDLLYPDDDIGMQLMYGWIKYDDDIPETDYNAFLITVSPPGYIRSTIPFNTKTIRFEQSCGVDDEQLGNLLTNILLYATSHPDKIERKEPIVSKKSKKGKKGKKLNEMIKNSQSIHYIGLPKSIQPLITLKEVKKVEDDKKRKINKRFMVRGHWRNQAFGRGFKDRKLIPIFPFWKGEGEIQNNRIHKL